MKRKIKAHNFTKEVFNPYYKEIYNFVFIRVGYKKELAEDLTQEIFIKIFENLDRFDSKKASIRTWLYKIARNHIIDSFRKNKSKEYENNFDIHKAIDTTAINIDNEILMQEVLEKLQYLKPTQKEIIELRYIQELKIKEIAQILNKKESAIKVMLHRAMKNLQSLINKKYVKAS